MKHEITEYVQQCVHEPLEIFSFKEGNGVERPIISKSSINEPGQPSVLDRRYQAYHLFYYW